VTGALGVEVAVNDEAIVDRLTLFVVAPRCCLVDTTMMILLFAAPSDEGCQGHLHIVDPDEPGQLDDGPL
jgi:hypothetical protein